MIKAKKLNKKDTLALICLSKGILGETFIQHSLLRGLERLKQFEIKTVMLENSLKGIKYLEEHPEDRAKDLKEAFKNDQIKIILSTIGGFDTYKTIPFLMDDDEFKSNVLKHPKIFLGYSDSTINHLMFYRLGLKTYYGLSFLTDIAELDKEMLPYTKEAFLQLFSSNKPKIKSSKI
ncbi:UNVERIFIED_CONTAM: LD-carboxypeptidase [Campylobacter lari]